MPTRIEQWDQRYRDGAQVFETPAPLVVEFTKSLAPGSAIDLACGPGRNALYLAERGWRVTAVDASSVAIGLLHGANPSIDASVFDLEAGEFEVPSNAYDLMLSCYYFQRSLIPTMKSALRAGGLLILIAHVADPDQPQGTRTRAFSGELPTFFEGWNILFYREGEPGESCHRHAVAELVARKPG
jgi:SAM-dependent methyltransferase